LIADALSFGKEGVISLEEGKGIVTELEITEGKLEKVYLTLFHYEYRKMEVSYDNPYSSNG
jgi:hypothetical protein